MSVSLSLLEACHYSMGQSLVLTFLLSHKICSVTDPVVSSYQRLTLTCKVRSAVGSQFLTAIQKLEVSESGLIASK